MLKIYVHTRHHGHNQEVTHRTRTPYTITGFRAAEWIFENELTKAGRQLVNLMDGDLSGVLEDDDLTPRLCRQYRTVNVIEAAQLLGWGDAVAARVMRCFGPNDPLEWCDVRFHVLGWKSVEDAINKTAATPGMAVQACRGGPRVRLNGLPLDDSPAHRLEQAQRWAHVLRRCA